MRIFVCSPLRPVPPDWLLLKFPEDTWQYERWWRETYDKHIRMAREHCAKVVEAGHRPYAPHLFFPQFLDERNPTHRKLGMEMGIVELDSCDQLWFWDPPTSGMKAEIQRCIAHGIPVIYQGDEPIDVTFDQPVYGSEGRQLTFFKGVDATNFVKSFLAAKVKVVVPPVAETSVSESLANVSIVTRDPLKTTLVNPETRRLEKQAAWDKSYMAMAHLVAEHSHDPKFKVGAIVVNDTNGAIAGLGYNGRGKGRPNDRFSMETGQSGFVHAEMNAIARVSWEMLCTYTLYTTLSPCVICAGLILNNPIKRVVYGKVYPGDQGLAEVESGLGKSNVLCCPHH